MPELLEMDEAGRNERLHRFSHDLKNRLGALWQAANLLHELPPGPEHKELVEMAEKNYFAGARQVEQLLDGFGVPRGVETAHREIVAVRQVLERSVKSMAFRSTPKKQHYVLSVGADVRVLADPRLFANIAEALLSNASKFSPEGAQINIFAEEADGLLQLTVVDPGVGLSGKDLEEIFTRYAMLSSQSTGGESQARSTLSRAKQWAEAQGGTLSASSQGIGKGSSFTVALLVA